MGTQTKHFLRESARCTSKAKVADIPQGVHQFHGIRPSGPERDNFGKMLTDWSQAFVAEFCAD
jgi:hypothetical protein